MKFKNKIEQAIDSLVEIKASEKPSYYDIGHGQYPTTIWCMHKGKLLTQKGVDLAHEEEWPDIVNDCTYAGRFDPKKKEVSVAPIWPDIPPPPQFVIRRLHDQFGQGTKIHVIGREFYDESVMHTFIFKDRDSQKEMFRVSAASRAQAIWKAKKANPSIAWLDKDVESGRIVIDPEIVKPAILPASVRKIEGDPCPSCNSGPEFQRTIATGECTCKKCGAIWDN